jgi:hypothetical protein
LPLSSPECESPCPPPGPPPPPRGGGPRDETRAANNYRKKDKSKATYCLNNKRTYENDADDNFNHVCVFCLSLLLTTFLPYLYADRRGEKNRRKTQKKKKVHSFFF